MRRVFQTGRGVKPVAGRAGVTIGVLLLVACGGGGIGGGSGLATSNVASGAASAAALQPTQNGLSYPTSSLVGAGTAQQSYLPPGQGDGRLRLSWSLPQRYEDGSGVTQPLTLRIHYGRTPRAYELAITVAEPGATRYELQGLAPGTWYFAVTAVDPQGRESDYSAETQAWVN